MGYILAGPHPALPVTLGSLDSDSLLPGMVTQTKVISKAQRNLQRAVTYEPRDLKSYLSMKHFSFGEESGSQRCVVWSDLLEPAWSALGQSSLPN